MFGSSVPRFYFGVNLTASYKNFEISADFQGMTGVTTSLLNSPLYQPLVNNGNISQTFLNNETPWTPENASQATMPRLTTLTNANNYRANSLWYRDGSFSKLRNLYASYTFPKKDDTFCGHEGLPAKEATSSHWTISVLPTPNNWEPYTLPHALTGQESSSTFNPKYN